ncbi:MAG: CubicO group peptidase (beta-lactamase class C family) [Arcticibacterium sp.]|jgi:CubicO group peptidase (beta-lactamase class C family)
MFSRLCLVLMVYSALLSCDYTKHGVDLESKRVADSLRVVETLDSVRIAISAEMKSNSIKSILNNKVRTGFNGSALIYQSGITLLDTVYGYANFEDKIKLTNETPFQLASLSKTFTSISVLKLVEEGKLSLDLTVKDYFPKFPYEGVTLRSLLSHRSGLPYYQYTFDKKARAEKVFPDNQLLMKWFENASPKPKIFNLPDHYFSYNNSNYAILAAIIEKVSEDDFAHFLKKNIFEPLKMNHSSFVTELNDSLPRTYGYQYGRRIPFDIYDKIGGDKGIYSTTNDLLKWYQALKSEKIISKASLREAYTPRSFEFPGLRNYGYGFRLWLNDKQQTDYVYHTGWWKGYNTIMFFDLREDFVIILLSNKYNKDVYKIKEIIDVLHGGKKDTSVEENILDQ